jgi:hypothetical protein
MPYQHKDMLRFLKEIKKKYKPDFVLNMGDEADKHAMSFHASDSELYSAGDELLKTIEYIRGLYKVFPYMTLLESNHGSMCIRKAKVNGIPLKYLKSYNDIYDVPDTWKWAPELVLKLSNGQKVYACHGKIKDSAKLSQQMSMNVIQGHYHESFKIEYWSNPGGLYWGMNVGCLIDNSSMAFAYNKIFPKRPIIGTGIIIDGQPKLLPMVLNNKGRWTGKVP